METQWITLNESELYEINNEGVIRNIETHILKSTRNKSVRFEDNNRRSYSIASLLMKYFKDDYWENHINEEWKQVVGFEGLYEVSNLGRVRSMPNVTVRSSGRIYTWPARILKVRLRGKKR